VALIVWTNAMSVGVDIFKTKLSLYVIAAAATVTFFCN